MDAGVRTSRTFAVDDVPPAAALLPAEEPYSAPVQD
jgi:hypothetical protein